MISSFLTCFPVSKLIFLSLDIPPEIINSYISSNNPDSSWAKSGDSVFVTFVSSEPLININLTIANVVSDYVQVNPTKYVGYQLMTLDIEQGVLPFSLTYF